MYAALHQHELVPLVGINALSQHVPGWPDWDNSGTPALSLKQAKGCVAALLVPPSRDCIDCGPSCWKLTVRQPSRFKRGTHPIFFLDSSVRAQPSTAMSWVAANKTSRKNMAVMETTSAFSTLQCVSA